MSLFGRYLPLALLLLACGPSVEGLSARYQQQWSCPTVNVTKEEGSLSDDFYVEGCGHKAHHKIPMNREAGSNQMIGGPEEVSCSNPDGTYASPEDGYCPR